MLPLSPLIFLPVLVPSSFAAPHLFTRNDSTSAVIMTTVNFSSSNDTNHTIAPPSFRTLLYLPPSTIALSSLTGRNSQPRLLYRCRSPTAIFHHSHCLHNAGLTGAMQRYIIYCREPSPPPSEHRHTPPPLGEVGMCTTEEICVNAWIGDRGNRISVARCIAKSAFDTMDSIDDDMSQAGPGRGQGRDKGPGLMDADDDSKEDNSGHLGGEKRRKLERGFVLGGNQASVVASKEDEATPLEVESMEVDAVVDEGRTHIEKSCRNCFELRTQKLAPNTSGLNMEATLVTAGSGLAAGVLWVALMSG